MTLTKLISLTARLSNRMMLQRFVAKQPTRSQQTKSTNDIDIDEVDNSPIKFSTSPAATWEAADSQAGAKNTAPWFQPISIGLSSVVFLIYFLYLREPNDIDAIFDKELGDHFTDAQIASLTKAANSSNYGK